MSSILFLGILISVIIISLIASGYANYRQQQRLKLRKMSQQLRKSAEHFRELASVIDHLSNNKSMAAELIGMSINTYQRMLTIEPNSEYVLTSLQSAKEFAQTLSNPAPIDTAFNTDLEIYRTKRQLEDIEKIFRKMVDRGNLANEIFEEYHQELVWLYLQIQVDSMVHQADLAKERKDKVKSLAFYQKALNLLKQSSILDPRKQTRIKAIADLLSGKTD